MSDKTTLKETSIMKRKREVEVAEIGPKGSNPLNQRMKLDALFEYIQGIINSYG